MRRRNLIACLAAAFVAVLGARETSAAGYFNVPGTIAQRTGHGFGGGYHAPLMLGPVQHDGWGLGRPVRLPYAPTPYYEYAACGDCGRLIEAPSSLQGLVPTAAPPVAVAPTPGPAPVAAPTPAPAPAPIAPAEPQVVETPVVTSTGDASLEPEPVVVPADDTVAAPSKPLFEAPVQP